ncbi:TolC family protein [Carboxylicivirga sp. N1Y90]|uniref:TolC family protein n=1 Tax=Carboxylicivirga fragile TaxID=3417571 RepID=UPI003D32BCB7|nr:TolC family protein [Marinilabiliaceae bacterium N1Y90]
MIQKALLAFAAILLLTSASQAQEVKQWSLLECITYAHENNITIKRQVINADYQDNLLKQSKNDRLPDLNASLSGNLNYGYTWVQQEAANVQESTYSLSPGITSNISVFEGMTKSNTIKRNEYNLKAALEDSKKTKNDIALQITAQYMQILFDKELLAVAIEQAETSKMQVERTKKLVDAGSVAMGNLLEIKSQAAKEALNVTQQENNLMVSLLSLAQLLDIENPVGFDIESPNIPELNQFLPDQPNTIFATALDIMPEIKSSQYNLNSSEYDLKIAKGGFYPTFGLGIGMNASSFSLLDDPNNYNTSIGSQWDRTRSSYLGFSLRIPIFNRLQTKTSVSNARIGVNDAQLQLEQQKQNLRKDIQQAYVDARSSYNKYLSSVEAVNSFKESFRYTEKKFNVGLVNSVDYNVSKTDFTRAQSDLLQAKYEYVLRTKILDFYKGIPIEL